MMKLFYELMQTWLLPEKRKKSMAPPLFKTHLCFNGQELFVLLSFFCNLQSCKIAQRHEDTTRSNLFTHFRVFHNFF